VRYVVHIRETSRKRMRYLSVRDDEPVAVSFATTFKTKKEAGGAAKAAGYKEEQFQVMKKWW